MPRGLHNWNFKKVTHVLKQHGFYCIRTRGSHHYFTGTVNKKVHMVTVPRHDKSIAPGTMKSIMIQSGLSESVWKN